MTDGRVARFLVAVVAPLTVVAFAYALWWISDRLVYIGPLDRAAFGWAVVVPVWLCAPIVAGLTWRPLSRPATAAAALTLGALIAIVSAIVFWRAAASPGCAYGATRTQLDWVLPSLAIGVAVGTGLVISSLIAVVVVRAGHPWLAAGIGAAAAFVSIFVAILVFVLITPALGCQRPSLV